MPVATLESSFFLLCFEITWLFGDPPERIQSSLCWSWMTLHWTEGQGHTNQKLLKSLKSGEPMCGCLGQRHGVAPMQVCHLHSHVISCPASSVESNNAWLCHCWAALVRFGDQQTWSTWPHTGGIDLWGWSQTGVPWWKVSFLQQ